MSSTLTPNRLAIRTRKASASKLSTLTPTRKVLATTGRY